MHPGSAIGAKFVNHCAGLKHISFYELTFGAFVIVYGHYAIQSSTFTIGPHSTGTG